MEYKESVRKKEHSLGGEENIGSNYIYIHICTDVHLCGNTSYKTMRQETDKEHSFE
jgi:hypothetical protein